MIFASVMYNDKEKIYNAITRISVFEIVLILLKIQKKKKGVGGKKLFIKSITREEI